MFVSLSPDEDEFHGVQSNQKTSMADAQISQIQVPGSDYSESVSTTPGIALR